MKRPISFFVSYRSTEDRLTRDLITKLQILFGASRNYQLQLWRDRDDILLGEDWHAHILTAIEECDFGLALISPDYLTRDYIKNFELPKYVGPAATKPLLPVLLKPLSARQDWLGLEAKQIFSVGGKSYRDAAHRDRFVEALYEAIERRLDRHFAVAAK